jgi:protein-tyrosine-phosphatase
MAEAYARQMGAGQIEAFSAGSRPVKYIDPSAVLVMKEDGLGISLARPKHFKDLPDGIFDYAVSMGCKDVCPTARAQTHIAWKIPNPKKRNLATYRRVRDAVKEHVAHLVQIIINNGHREDKKVS